MVRVNQVALSSLPLWHRASAQRERISLAAKLFVAILFVVVLEGAVRKWISAELTTPVVLVRDTLAVWMVLHALGAGHLRFNRLSGLLLGVWSVVVIGWSLLQAVLNDIPIEILAIGLRFWLLYLWCAVAFSVSITERDFRFIVRAILMLMVVTAPLVVAQYLQPPEAFINKQVSDVEDDRVFTVIFGVVRTTGTFSFTLGYSTFLGLVTPFSLAYLTSKSNHSKDKYWKAIALGALLVGTMVSGSRTAFVNFFVAIFIYLGYLFFITRVRLKFRTYTAIVVGAVLVVVFAGVFSNALDAIEERAEGATESENVSLRIVEMFTGTPELRENFDIVGSGIGYGANFAGVVLTGERAFLNGENEMERTLYSGGLLGLFFVAAKFLVCGWGVYRSLGIARASSVLPLLLWVAASVALLTWSITGQLTANAMGFIVAGLALASMRFPSVGAMR